MIAQGFNASFLVLLRNPASHAHGLEGSRFRRWQLYRLAAGGSRELPNAMFCPSRLFRAAEQRALELPHLETFAGAACSQPIELPVYKAAPLQAFGPLDTRRVCPSVFLPLLQALVRNFLNWTTQGRRLSARL